MIPPPGNFSAAPVPDPPGSSLLKRVLFISRATHLASEVRNAPSPTVPDSERAKKKKTISNEALNNVEAGVHCYQLDPLLRFSPKKLKIKGRCIISLMTYSAHFPSCATALIYNSFDVKFH